MEWIRSSLGLETAVSYAMIPFFAGIDMRLKVWFVKDPVVRAGRCRAEGTSTMDREDFFARSFVTEG